MTQTIPVLGPFSKEVNARNSGFLNSWAHNLEPWASV